MKLDLATVGGFAVGLVLIIGAIILGGQPIIFVSFSSLLIVVGGTLAAATASYSFKHIQDLIKILKIAFYEQSMDPQEVISILVSFAEKARREGLLALEDETQDLDEPFLQKGIQLVVDGTDSELVRSILETELAFLDERHATSRGIFGTMAELAPAFGMMGTLIGLIQMLSTLDDPQNVGGGLATALITTFYGTFMANLIFIPLSKKLKMKSEEEILVKEVMIEGILSIQAGENPRIVEEKLKAFLSGSIRETLEEEELNAEGEMAVGSNAAS
ncbi:MULTISPECIES: motility protein A [unclassified Candidatus Frackibacter]|uniref:motility protein A n=1 Tax=unclassified Candidatus Frackibacter TaxID=2648818 RepID=UPI000792CD69|nr:MULTISPECIES: motility protein A [unclassified Candidatus Frackibacter]KXS45233.1 MAG: chemotaxis protein MotA [Candidatus Frackibacter sp. T328-2]SDB99498.1 chemotaxis protein MotA [Candidatus Frackibacter sp. WG11]SEM31135.1 chemotaxis protein MotA [Candidatus Frackibacter sp. WG12]SFL36101.1 chemotaxis protein MotA [Candidatus Frackibacter sp. WG13]